MRKAFKRLCNLLLYCGFTKEEYKIVKKDAYISNFNAWKYLHVFMAIIFAALLGISLLNGNAIVNVAVRGGLLVYSLVCVVLMFCIIPSDSVRGQLLIYVTMIILLALGVWTGLRRPEMMAVTFEVLLVMVAMFMIDKPYYMVLVVMGAVFVYMRLISGVKTGVALRGDTINTFIYAAASIVINIFYNHLRMNEFLLNHANEIRLDKELARERNDLEKQQLELEHATEELKKASRNRAEFMFNISHDIRTPLNAILGFTDIALRNTDDREKITDCLDKTKKSGEHLLTLINNILDMSRAEVGNASLNEQRVDILLAYANIRPAMLELAAEKNIDLTFEINEIENRYVFIDALRANQLLTNLITNAIAFTPQDGRVRVALRQLELSPVDYGRYEFTVEDNGIGMGDEFRPVAFDEFAREDTDNIGLNHGNGLGLPICRSIVQLMGGEITFKSEKGTGTTFTVILPLRLQKDADISCDTIIDTACLIGRRVLLVDDDELSREITDDILHNADIITEEAENGAVAVAMVRQHEVDYYDFILMDIRMPVIDGYEATRKIRAASPSHRIPIIGLSANASEDDRRRAFEYGMDAYLEKPTDAPTLLRTLRQQYHPEEY